MAETTAQHGSAAIATAGNCCFRRTHVPAAEAAAWQPRQLGLTWRGGCQ
jgi:hypothetical protein